MTRRLCLQEVLQNVLRRSPSRAANAAYSVFVIQSQSTVELNDNGISLEVGLGVAEQMLLNKPNLDMNKDTVFGKTGRCLGRLVGAYVFRKTGTDRAFYWRKGLRDEEGGMWQLLQQVVGGHIRMFGCSGIRASVRPQLGDKPCFEGRPK